MVFAVQQLRAELISVVQGSGVEVVFAVQESGVGGGGSCMNHE